jgi:hypothetical protein
MVQPLDPTIFAGKRTFEIQSSGLDEFLQAQGGDPFGGSSSFGLRVPTLATPDKDHRYLFLGASYSIGEGACTRIVGYRQFASIGVLLSPSRFVEMEIQSPNFRLPDGNISWHLHRLGPPNNSGYPKTDPTPLDLNSFKRLWADGPCLLYGKYTIAAGNRIYPQLLSYTPPNLGRPWGTPLSAGNQGTFYDLRTESRTHGAWHALDMVVEGPDTIAFFISVKQSTGVYEVAVPPVPNGIPEEQFLSAFGGGESPGPRYWRVGVSLIVEAM